MIVYPRTYAFCVEHRLDRIWGQGCLNAVVICHRIRGVRRTDKIVSQFWFDFMGHDMIWEYCVARGASNKITPPPPFLDNNGKIKLCDMNMVTKN
jgi:hypothetical protein